MFIEKDDIDFNDQLKSFMAESLNEMVIDRVKCSINDAFYSFEKELPIGSFNVYIGEDHEIVGTLLLKELVNVSLVNEDNDFNNSLADEFERLAGVLRRRKEKCGHV